VIRWLELTLDYRCNNRCVGCFSVQDHGPEMSPREIREALAAGRRDGATALWLGGGEPTLRPELIAIVREARRLGFEQVKLQTNGMMLAYAEYAQRCAGAGVTEVSFSIKGSTAELHDRLAQAPGCHALMVRGIEHARTAGLALEADLLVYRSNVNDLGAMVETYGAMGVTQFRLWLLSAADSDDARVRDEVPRVSDVATALGTMLDANTASPAHRIRSLHLPPCVVAERHRFALLDVATLAMRVVNPGGHAFALEQSPIEGGTYLPRCSECALRSRCRGIRQDYLAIHGDAEFRPV
jgi:cyclic pyranopterin phosphate synthase